MDTVLVRAVSPGDHQAVADLHARAGRTPADVPPSSDRCVATTVGPPERVVGFAAGWHVRLDKFRIDLFVDPQWRRRGVGSRLVSHVASQARAAGAATLQARAASDDTESLGFFVASGFVETMRMHQQVLEVAQASLPPTEHILARLAEQGIAIVPLEHELARMDSVWEEFCRLYNAGREGWPDPDPGPKPSLTPAEFQRHHQASVQEHGVGMAECFMAVRGNRYVGFTGAVGTAVDPAFRQRGIATALKVRATRTARDLGIATLETWTGNPAILRINQKLGYKLISTQVRLVTPIKPAPNPH